MLVIATSHSSSSEKERGGKQLVILDSRIEQNIDRQSAWGAVFHSGAQGGGQILRIVGTLPQRHL